MRNYEKPYEAIRRMWIVSRGSMCQECKIMEEEQKIRLVRVGARHNV